MTADTHEYGRPDPRASLNLRLETLEILLRETLPLRPENTFEVFQVALECAALACHVGELSRVRELLNLSLDGAVATFQLAAGVTTVTVAGRAVEYAEATGPTDFANAHVWVEAVCLALTLRRSAAIDELLAVDGALLQQSPTQMDRYRLILVDAVAAVLAERDAQAVIAEVREQMIHDGAVGDYDAILRGFIDGLAALDRVQPESLATALAELLTAHRAYWGSKRWSRHPEGLISVHGLGLACLARDRGLPLTIDSGYVPAWLVEQQEPG